MKRGLSLFAAATTVHNLRLELVVRPVRGLLQVALDHLLGPVRHEAVALAHEPVRGPAVLLLAHVLVHPSRMPPVEVAGLAPAHLLMRLK